MNPIQVSLITIPIAFIYAIIIISILKPQKINILFMYAFTIALAISIGTFLL